jgi:hypothetical protein
MVWRDSVPRMNTLDVLAGGAVGAHLQAGGARQQLGQRARGGGFDLARLTTTTSLTSSSVRVGLRVAVTTVSPRAATWMGQRGFVKALGSGAKTPRQGQRQQGKPRRRTEVVCIM